MNINCPHCQGPIEITVAAVYAKPMPPEYHPTNGAPEQPWTTPQPTTNGMCPVHGVLFVFKSGHARNTGKPYAFWACPVRDANGFCQQKAPQPVQNAPGAAQGYGVAPAPIGELP